MFKHYSDDGRSLRVKLVNRFKIFMGLGINGWGIFSGGSKGGSKAHTAQNFLNFMWFFFVKCAKICMLAPLDEVWFPLLRGVLDPPRFSAAQNK